MEDESDRPEESRRGPINYSDADWAIWLPCWRAHCARMPQRVQGPDETPGRGRTQRPPALGAVVPSITAVAVVSVVPGITAVAVVSVVPSITAAVAGRVVVEQPYPP